MKATRHLIAGCAYDTKQAASLLDTHVVRYTNMYCWYHQGKTTLLYKFQGQQSSSKSHCWVMITSHQGAGCADKVEALVRADHCLVILLLNQLNKTFTPKLGSMCLQHNGMGTLFYFIIINPTPLEQTPSDLLFSCCHCRTCCLCAHLRHCAELHIDMVEES